MFHIFLHLLIPLIIVLAFYRKNWKYVFLVLIATMLVDIDHLLANPIYDPLRCSINFHPLHTFFPIAGYVGMTIWKKTRLVGLGLVIHMALDSVDCQYTNGVWYQPF